MNDELNDQVDPKPEPRKFPTTMGIAEKNAAYSAMSDVLEGYCMPRFWFRPSPRDIASFCRELGVLRAELSTEILRVYPQTRDGEWAVSAQYVTEVLP